MSKKMKDAGQVAIIDIGSNGLRLKIAESGKKSMKYIESLSYPLSLGKDTFDTGKISFEKVDKACDIIKNFIIVAKEYGVTDIRAVATSAVREATNRDYLLDQIKIKTSLNINVIDDVEEKLYLYKLMSHLLEPKQKQSAMMVYIGSGNVGVSIMEDGKIPFIQNIKIGSLRISEIFLDLQDESSEYYRVVEEYLESFTYILDDMVPQGLNHFIASGHEVSIIADLCQARTDGAFAYISKEKFLKLYNEMKMKTADRLALDYNIPAEKTQVLLPTMSIFYNLLKLTEATEIIAPAVFLSDSILFETLYPDEFNAINKEFSRNTIISAKAYASHYQAQESHYVNVAQYALKIFDKMKKIHGMGQREKLYLQTGAILHDVGRFINPRKHYMHSYTIVKASEIVGLNVLEREIVACLCMYHSRRTPQSSHEQYARLSSENRVLVSKLTAILRLADALDPSSEQKFSDIDVKVSEDELTVTITAEKNIDLEQWSFKNKSVFFEEVFGIKAVLKKRRTI